MIAASISASDVRVIRTSISEGDEFILVLKITD